MHGDIAGARVSYQQALALDPNLIDAATNLGVIEAQSGNFPQAVKLLQAAFNRAPGQSNIGMDLARVFCLEGKLEEGRSSLARVLEYNPDMSAAKRLLEDLKQPKPSCNAN